MSNVKQTKNTNIHKYEETKDQVADYHMYVERKTDPKLTGHRKNTINIFHSQNFL